MRRLKRLPVDGVWNLGERCQTERERAQMSLLSLEHGPNLRDSHFSIRACHINERLGLEWRQSKKYETKDMVAIQCLRHVQNWGC
ncbi:hypothetical protein TNCV_1184271 [Trichonephila clavipes]|nr:hypothetical protein TNCV_1184271 [Trichonephila clavipes]